jgi:EAL domain-containing protein (putative c-di-GMP-specific phosphodiesterase class I)/DNA-binding NarL/FixJ family response regulator
MLGTIRGKKMADTDRRLLIVDDNPAIHEDFRKILCRYSGADTALSEAEAHVFGSGANDVPPDTFEVDAAVQGDDGIAMVREALAMGRPYAVAFVDVRMPPGIDGVETAAQLFALDPDIQVVICTAFSDYTLEQIRANLGRTGRLMILKKPFDPIEVQQLADVLSQKWERVRDGKARLMTLQQMVRDRSHELHGTTNWLESKDADLAKAAEFVDVKVQQQLVLESELRVALESGQLSVHYQPLVNIATRRVVGVEALARWQHPRKGSISPAVFIPVAEQSGLILALGEFVLRTACSQVASWQRDGAELTVSINISAVQLRRQNVLELARGVLRETGLSAERLVLEITESALIENLNKIVSSLRLLRSDGVGVAIDDFGTGYSSLSYLQQLPITTLKIDRAFVRRIHENSVDASIVSAVIAMARGMKANVVAEGVETAAQLQTILALGCDAAQGYLFAPPLSAADCKKMIATIAAAAPPSPSIHVPASIASQPLGMADGESRRSP